MIDIQSAQAMVMSIATNTKAYDLRGSKLEIRRYRNTALFEVSIRYSDPIVAAQMANTVCEQFTTLNPDATIVDMATPKMKAIPKYPWFYRTTFQQGR